MANEISITASLSASKGGAAISSGTLSKSLDMSGDSVQSQTALIGHASNEELVKAGDIGTIGYLAVKNLSSTDAVSFSFDTSSFPAYTFATVPAGGIMLIPVAFPTDKSHIYAQAASTDVLVQYWVVEA